MFEKIIEFQAPKKYLELKHCYPEPVKLNVPDWYKKLKHVVEKRTIKGCMPFLDTLTTGYILKLPQDVYIEHNVYNKNERETSISSGLMGHINSFTDSLNLNKSKEMHPIHQLEGSPHVQKNKTLPIHKLLNPWTIKTPPGYSCLFVPPLNNTDDRFSIIPGIVDTDSFPAEINFPYIINGDKYPVLKSLIKMGTPYVQIIPFKRESWKMKIKEVPNSRMLRNRFVAALQLFETYKNNWWHKKSWK